MYYVYFLRGLKNSKIYIGCSEKDPKERLIEHNAGTNDWSRHNGPFELAYFESYHCKSDALHHEIFYKSGFGRKVRDAILVAVSARGGPGRMTGRVPLARPSSSARFHRSSRWKLSFQTTMASEVELSSTRQKDPQSGLFVFFKLFLD